MTHAHPSRPLVRHALTASPQPSIRDRVASVEPLIRSASRRLSARRGFVRSDREDIEQALRLHLVDRVRVFTASRSAWAWFAKIAVENHSTSILRHRFAARRSPRRERYSLDEPIPDRDGQYVPRHTLIAAPVGRRPDAEDLRLDVSAFRKQIRSPLECDLLDALMAGGSIDSFRKDRRVPRRAAMRCFDELVRHAEGSGLAVYLPSVQRRTIAA